MHSLSRNKNTTRLNFIPFGATHVIPVLFLRFIVIVGHHRLRGFMHIIRSKLFVSYQNQWVFIRYFSFPTCSDVDVLVFVASYALLFQFLVSEEIMYKRVDMHAFTSIRRSLSILLSSFFSSIFFPLCFCFPILLVERLNARSQHWTSTGVSRTNGSFALTLCRLRDWCRRHQIWRFEAEPAQPTRYYRQYTCSFIEWMVVYQHEKKQLIIRIENLRSERRCFFSIEGYWPCCLFQNKKGQLIRKREKSRL